MGGKISVGSFSKQTRPVKTITIDKTQEKMGRLIKNSNTKGKNNFKVGQYVFLQNDNVRTINKIHQFGNPQNRDLYKILRSEKDNFSFQILNIRNQSERTCCFTASIYQIWYFLHYFWFFASPFKSLNRNLDDDYETSDRKLLQNFPLQTLSMSLI